VSGAEQNAAEIIATNGLYPNDPLFKMKRRPELDGAPISLIGA